MLVHVVQNLQASDYEQMKSDLFWVLLYLLSKN